jgi:hypothetical protein
MSKYQPKKSNIIIPEININQESKDKLFSLASSLNLSELEEFITTNSIPLNVKNNNNESIIHVILKAESTIDEEELLRCIKFLISRDAPISSIDNSSLTPILLCINKNYNKIFEYLLDNGASLDINTYDNLTPLHILSQPKHDTYNTENIKNIIPEKIPKIKMENYKKIYEEIIKKLDLSDTSELKIFSDIAKQFYYDDEREDFNNVLLLKDAVNNPDIKNDLFKKLKKQLDIFYTDDEINDINIAELNSKLVNIKNQLNKEFTKENMKKYNDNVLNAIKLISYSLELSIHFFYNKELQECQEILNSLDIKLVLLPIFNLFNKYNNILNSPYPYEGINIPRINGIPTDPLPVIQFKSAIPLPIALDSTYKAELLFILENNTNNIIPELEQLKINLKPNRELFCEDYTTLAILFKLVDIPLLLDVLSILFNNLIEIIPNTNSNQNNIRIGIKRAAKMLSLSLSIIVSLEMQNLIRTIRIIITNILRTITTAIDNNINTARTAAGGTITPAIIQTEVINTVLNQFRSNTTVINDIIQIRTLIKPRQPVQYIKEEQNILNGFNNNNLENINGLENILLNIYFIINYYKIYQDPQRDINGNIIRGIPQYQPSLLTALNQSQIPEIKQPQELNNLMRNLISTDKLSLDNIKTLVKLGIINNLINKNYPIIHKELELPKHFNNEDYNDLVTLYKLPQLQPQPQLNIPYGPQLPTAGQPQPILFFNKNEKYQYNHENNKKYLGNLNKYLETNTSYKNDIIPPLALYSLGSGSYNYIIDYFNLLHVFNEYAINDYVPINNITNIFELYQNIQKIYKYNYIIYIFEKEKNKILNLKNYDHNNIELKKLLDDLFDKTFQELEKSIQLIKEQLNKIENLSNKYIDIYNKITGYKIYSDTPPFNIGIYPKIKFPIEIKYTKDEEIIIINNVKRDYKLYYEQKNDFFHNFVLYFQDIGIYNNIVYDDDNIVLNINIPIDRTNNINYDIDIQKYNLYNSVATDIINNKNKIKAYKLYFYDPNYLKLTKQNIINQLLPKINDISISNIYNYNIMIFNNLNTTIKTKILNELVENKFNEILVSEINNFFYTNLLNPSLASELKYNPEIKTINLQFPKIVIPNYEFTNNKFLYIINNEFIFLSRNKYLRLKLYFDNNYFNSDNLKVLKYYKQNNFIEKILDKNKSLLLKTDIKGWTPLYYAIDGNNYEIIEKILNLISIDVLRHYDNKKISPFKLCINKQLHHLNYLLSDDDKNEIYYLKNYQKMLKKDLLSNKLLIPLNIESIFTIALFIQNHIWLNNGYSQYLNNYTFINSRKKQINEEHNIFINNKNINNFYYDNQNYIDNIYNNDIFNNNDNKINNNNKESSYTENNIINNIYNKQNDLNNIFNIYYNKANILEKQEIGSYSSYWLNYDNNKEILEHINKSIELKQILKNLLTLEETKYNLPKYDKTLINSLLPKLINIKIYLEKNLKFINIRFNNNDNNAYNIYLNKIYIHVLANIIGVDFYFKLEELIIKNYVELNYDININTNTVLKNQLIIINKILINNNLEDNNINYKYITTEKNPELILKNNIIEILKGLNLPNQEEIISTYETSIYPYYRDLYKITFKHLKMFMTNYHKFIYNQYHELEILLLLLEKL